MAKSVYVLSTEADSGKFVVSMGLIVVDAGKMYCQLGSRSSGSLKAQQYLVLLCFLIKCLMFKISCGSGDRSRRTNYLENRGWISAINLLNISVLL